MTISGFTFLRNANKLHYPIRESILSILEIVDEFVIALGKGDIDDTSLAIIQDINSPKIKIINTVWALDKYPNGTVYAHQTDLAKQHCTGDWLFYLQGDELIHEDDLEEIKTACSLNFSNKKIEGFVFNYLHFWGDYEHYFADHCWYQREVRIIRNIPEIQSWRDAQSFRFVTDSQNYSYGSNENSRKLNCKLLTARVFHYGWVRPPDKIKIKNEQVMKNYNQSFLNFDSNGFDFGRMDYCKIFNESHPKNMARKIEELNWKDSLRYKGPNTIGRNELKHEKLKYRIIIWIEKNLLGGILIGGFKNYKLID